MDLHNLNGKGNSITENDIWIALDRFINNVKLQNSRQIKTEIPVKICIVVGKGLQSKNFINGKSILRFHTEKYLDKCGYSWRDGHYNQGGTGAILADIL